jgi:ABC-type sugar transport system substrate-binding protein
MSKAKRQPFDVFLAHDPSDNALATAVMDRFGAAGLSAFSVSLSEPKPLDPSATRVRDELRDCSAFVVLLTPAFAASETLPFLVGAALMAGTPVFVLTADDAVSERVPYLGSYPVARLWSGIDELVRHVRKAGANSRLPLKVG